MKARVRERRNDRRSEGAPKIEKMTCGGRAAGLAARLRSLPGVRSARANYERDRAVVVDGKLAECCVGRGPEEAMLRQAGLGRPIK